MAIRVQLFKEDPRDFRLPKITRKGHPTQDPNRDHHLRLNVGVFGRGLKLQQCPRPVRSPIGRSTRGAWDAIAAPAVPGHGDGERLGTVLAKIKRRNLEGPGLLGDQLKLPGVLSVDTAVDGGILAAPGLIEDFKMGIERAEVRVPIGLKLSNQRQGEGLIDRHRIAIQHRLDFNRLSDRKPSQPKAQAHQPPDAPWGPLRVAAIKPAGFSHKHGIHFKNL